MSKLDPRLAYREATVRSATPLQLVVIQYDIAISDIRRALDAMKSNDIEGRTNAVRHCMLVLQNLQGTLDFERGGEPAKNLNRFYSLIRAKLLEAQIKISSEVMEQQIALLLQVRDAWRKICEQQSALDFPGGLSSPAPVQTPVLEAAPLANWSA